MDNFFFGTRIRRMRGWLGCLGLNCKFHSDVIYIPRGCNIYNRLTRTLILLQLLSSLIIVRFKMLFINFILGALLAGAGIAVPSPGM